jgi:hypothetical protein
MPSLSLSLRNGRYLKAQALGQGCQCRSVSWISGTSRAGHGSLQCAIERSCRFCVVREQNLLVSLLRKGTQLAGQNVGSRFRLRDVLSLDCR